MTFSDETKKNVTESDPSNALKRRRIVLKKAPGSKVIRRTESEEKADASESSSQPLPAPRTRVEPETMRVEEILETGHMEKVKTLAVKRPLPPRPAPDTEPEPEAPAAEEVVVKKNPPPLREVLGEPTFKFFCYRCGQKLQVPVSWANKYHSCARCSQEILIPPPLVGEFW